MNVLSVAVLLLPIILAVVVPFLMVGAYRKFRGKRIVTCPENGQPAAVEIDTRLAAVTAILGEHSLRLKTCSRWPEKKDCGQECLEQIKAAPEELVENWIQGKTCALCMRPISTVRGSEHYHALMDRAGKTIALDSFHREKIPEVLATHQPVCWSCHSSRCAPPSPARNSPETAHV